MYKQDINLYCNFKPQAMQNLKKINVRSLIMGHCGNGKTSFINKACNTSHRIGVTKGSLTRDIVYQDVVYFPQGKFRIYDTPGTSSITNALQHAKILRASLTNVPLNLILIQSKWQNRWEETISQLKTQIKIFKNFKQNVVFLISHIDSLDKESTKDKIIQQFVKDIQGIKTNVILYSNKNTDFKKLSSILYNLAIKKQPKNIKIDDETFYKYFNISCPITKIILDQIDEYVDAMKNKTQVFVNFFKNLPKDTPDIQNIISELKICMKNELKNYQDEQYRQYNQKFNNDYKTADMYLMISQFIHSKLEEVDSICDTKLNKTYYDQFYKKQTNIRDMYKQCPNCKQIWIRVNGCFDTYCGNKPDRFDYIKNSALFRYQFKIAQNGIQFSKKPEKPIQQKKQIKNTAPQQQRNSTFFGKIINMLNISSRVLQQEKTIKGKGCGAKLIWNQLPRLPNIDDILQDIEKINHYQQTQQDVKKMQNQKAKYKELLDQKLKKNMEIIQKDKF